MQDIPTFLSTLSLRRATLLPTRKTRRNWHFYPRSPCGERPNRIRHRRLKPRHFYPRSPCGERPGQPRELAPARQISIHALLAESDIIDIINNVIDRIFLSTLSLRRATRRASRQQPAGEISIHALLAESDLISMLNGPHSKKFLSTLSLRRATIE